MTNPKQMPERIYASDDDHVYSPKPYGGSVEYIRGDLVPQLDVETQDAIADAIAARVWALSHNSGGVEYRDAVRGIVIDTLRRILTEAQGGQSDE